MVADKKVLNIAMFGHKHMLSREGGIEIVVSELATRMSQSGHKVVVYDRSTHHISGNTPLIFGINAIAAGPSEIGRAHV